MARNKNPLLPTADTAHLPTEKPRFEPPAPTEERGRETLAIAASADVPSNVMDEEAGGARGEWQETGKKSHVPKTHAEDEQTPEDWTVSRGKQPRGAWQAPNTVDAVVHDHAAETCASGRFRTRKRSGPEYRKGNQLRSPGLTVATTGLNFDRHDAGRFHLPQALSLGKQALVVGDQPLCRGVEDGGITPRSISTAPPSWACDDTAPRC